MFSQEVWNKGFAALQKFKKREGHCLVPRYHIEGAYRLGQWAQKVCNGFSAVVLPVSDRKKTTPRKDKVQPGPALSGP
jgi:hypothetical protein